MEQETTSTDESQLSFFFRTAQAEEAKFNSGVNASSTRARKALQEVIRLAKLKRKEITDTLNSRKAAKVASA
jgi:hypothetical protein